MSSTPSKGDLRIAALARRDALSDEQRAAGAEAIAKRGLPIEIEPGARRRLLADPQRDRSGAADANARGPWRAAGAAGDHRARQVAGVSCLVARDRLMLGSLGILEPSPAAAELVPDLMLVPLAAFDRAGHRIGYGAGHYDVTLAHLRKVKATTAIGLAFAVQEIKNVPMQPHDVALDYVLTEKQAFDFRSS